MSFTGFSLTLTSPKIPFSKNLKQLFQLFIPNQPSSGSLPVSAAPTTSFRWRSAGNRQRASPDFCWQGHDPSGDFAVEYRGSGRSFLLTHCKPMRKSSISKNSVHTSRIFVWPLANTAAKSQECHSSWYRQSCASRISATVSCYQICA